MDDPVLYMYYNNSLIEPSPKMSYQMNLDYSNDAIHGYHYSITLNGYCVAPPNSSAHITRSLAAKQQIENIFGQNHGTLKIVTLGSDGFRSLMYATGIIIEKIDFPQNENYWAKYINYTITLKANHLFIGDDITGLAPFIETGEEDLSLTQNLDTPLLVDITNHKIRSFTESFDINTSNHTEKNSIFLNTLLAGNNLIVPVEQGQVDSNASKEIGDTYLSSELGGEYCEITYSISAVGKHDIQNGATNPTTLPAWEHAKRFVHRKLLVQMGGLFSRFLNINNQSVRELLHDNTLGEGIFVDFENKDYRIYNEHYSFEISESAGSFSVTYNAIIKRNCTQDDGYLTATETLNPYSNDYISEASSNTSIIPNEPETNDRGCSQDVIHTVRKTVNKTYNANEDINDVNKEIEITIDGTIEGLVPGGILFSGSKFIINNLTQPGKTAFLAYNDAVNPLGLVNAGGVDKYSYAEDAFNRIFNEKKYDLTRAFKESVGVTADALSVSPTATLRPSRMSITKDFLRGTINYNAVYDNKYNCDPNNFEIQLKVDYPNPVIAEFVIPNNNLKNSVGKVCPKSRGYNLIQLLGTKTAKRIDVSINASVAQDFNKCCLGTADNWNLFDYDFLTLQEFIIPSGMNIPYIGDDYVLVDKTKRFTFPGGDLSISLSYVCADTCDIDGYFTEKGVPFNSINPSLNASFNETGIGLNFNPEKSDTITTYKTYESSPIQTTIAENYYIQNAGN